MKHEIEVEGKIYSFDVEDMDLNIEVAKDISIDYTNIVGDRAYTTILSNQVGFLKSDLETMVKKKELAVQEEEADFTLKLRKESANNGGYFTLDGVEVKNTEKALEKAYRSSKRWRNLKNDLFILERNLSKVESFYWKLNDKLKDLGQYTKVLYPEDMTMELISDEFNKLIKKKSKEKFAR